MGRISIWVLCISFILLLSKSTSADDEVKSALLTFFQSLSDGNTPSIPNFGWNPSSNPCFDGWYGVFCDPRSSTVRRIVLNGLGLRGTLNTSSICTIQSLISLSVQNNAIHGELQPDIEKCKQLTHIYINQNQFSGDLPGSLHRLNNLKRLYIFNNSFSGKLPDLPKISGLISVRAEFNNLRGRIPKFDFSNLQEFNVSYNNFDGPLPEIPSRIDASSFYGNPLLCGKPTPNHCRQDSHLSAVQQMLMFIGYVILGVVIAATFVFALFLKKKRRNEEYKMGDSVKKGAVHQDSRRASDSLQYEASKSPHLPPKSAESTPMMSMSLIIPRNSSMKTLRFEDLLKAPAELLGRGTYGSLYKVTAQGGSTLAVKRIKDWEIRDVDFKRRMEKLDHVKHPNVLPPLAFYCTHQEKLVAYAFQQKGSLLKLLQGSLARLIHSAFDSTVEIFKVKTHPPTHVHDLDIEFDIVCFMIITGAQKGQAFEWGSRLDIAATIAESLAFMHRELYVYGIAHGNLKSSNILLNENMDPSISEYGLMVVLMDGQLMSLVGHGSSNHFKADVYNFGVILLELLTGKVAMQVNGGGFDLAGWVHSVVREEWTVEVFDKSLIAEGAREGRLVSLLQVALRCINPSPEARPTFTEVVKMINAIREDEDKSTASEI
ncbi:hypothetical protein ACLOJK_031001 [Asimina triloba]